MTEIDDCRELGLLPEEVDGLRGPSGMFYTDHRNMVALEALAAALLEERAETNRLRDDVADLQDYFHKNLNIDPPLTRHDLARRTGGDA